MDRYILTVSMNAAVDIAYVIDGFAAGKINTVRELHRVAGGKANNCARVLVGALGQRVLATGFAGGFAGRFIQDDLRARGIEADYEETHGENRSCFAIVDPGTGEVSEIREKGPTLTANDCDRLRKRYERLLSGASLAVISGSLPPGVPVEMNGILAGIARRCGIPAILDVAGPALQQALSAQPFLVKPNEEELEQWAGRPLPTRADVLEAAHALRAAGPENVIVSLGMHGALAVTTGGTWYAVPPVVEAANTVGSGDSLVAGFASGVADGLAWEEVVRLAVACGTANAMTRGVAEVNPEELARIRGQVRLERLD